MAVRRTTLFVPGTAPEQQIRNTILTCGADRVCLDLEDTVVPARKQEGREMIARLLQEEIWGRSDRAVRINAVSSPYAEDDITELLTLSGGMVDTFLLSKPESVDEIRWIDNLVDKLRSKIGFERKIGYLVGMESARALTDIDLLSSCSPNVSGLGFAIGDLCTSLGVRVTAYMRDRSLYPGDLFHFHRARIVLAARTWRLEAMDAPWPIVTLAEDARWGAMMGFNGKLVLVPEQIKIVHQAYRPSDADIAHAKHMLAQMEKIVAGGDGAGVSGGDFLDPVVIGHARTTLAAAAEPI
jgi:citrate lyase subunit beta/citryl-CoA lyase